MKFRDYAKLGGFQPDGSYARRPSLREFAESLDVTYRWLRTIAGKNAWTERLARYDSAMAEWHAAQEQNLGTWAALMQRLLGRMATTDPDDLSVGETVTMMKLAQDRLAAYERIEKSRPLVISGLTMDDLRARLDADELATFQALLRKLR